MMQTLVDIINIRKNNSAIANIKKCANKNHIQFITLLGPPTLLDELLTIKKVCKKCGNIVCILCTNTNSTKCAMCVENKSDKLHDKYCLKHVDCMCFLCGKIMDNCIGKTKDKIYCTFDASKCNKKGIFILCSDCMYLDNKFIGKKILDHL